MSARWKQAAYVEIDRSLADPDHVPRYQIPARRWWQFWKPKWKWTEGLSQNQFRRALETGEIRF